MTPHTSTAPANRRMSVFLLGIAFIGFISLGLPDGLFGVAFPSIRQTFGIEIDSLGSLLFAGMIGYLTSSFFSGQIVAFMGIGRLLAASSLATAIALTGYTIAPAWEWMILLAVLSGAGGGAIDAGINTYIAENYGDRLMFWLHACYGIGATLGPLIMTASLGTDAGWRGGYMIVAVMQFALALCFFVTAPRWELPKTHHDTTANAEQIPTAKNVTVWQTLRVPVVWLGIFTFFLYTGVEAAAGQLTFTLFTEGRGVAEETAGVWLSIYWGTFTAGRFAAAFITRILSRTAFLRLSMLGTFIGALMIAWTGAEIVNVLGMVIIGFSLAPIFPALISATPERFGERHAANVIGFQIGAASLGASGVPSLISIVAKSVSLEMIPIGIAIAAALVMIFHEILLKITGNRRKSA